MHQTALITGITGQDGSYLAEFLLEKGYEVHGIVRRSSLPNTSRIDHLLKQNRITLHDGDLTDSSSLVRIISLTQPDEMYRFPSILRNIPVKWTPSAFCAFWKPFAFLG